MKIVLRAILFLFLAGIGMAGLAMSACGGLFALNDGSNRGAGLLFLAIGLAIAAGAFFAAQRVLKPRKDESGD
jgi:hypothetical protein